MLDLSNFLFCKARLLLLLDKNNRFCESCIKQTPSRQFSILTNDSDLREIDLHETS